MKYLNKISNDAFQEVILTGNQGQRITMRLKFMPSQESWVADFEYNEIKIYGVFVCASANILNFMKKTLPFGISCITTDNIDPATIDDFNIGYAKLYLLDQNDMDRIEGELFG